MSKKKNSESDRHMDLRIEQDGYYEYQERVQEKNCHLREKKSFEFTCTCQSRINQRMNDLDKKKKFLKFSDRSPKAILGSCSRQ
jgi:hypothetical protein